jgi:drug/metabolite transporter (DMT)-like permease
VLQVSFNQAIGACTPLFTALFSLLVQGRRESNATYLTLLPVVLGIAIASGFEPSFHLFGFVACIAATSLRAFKSVLQARFYVQDIVALQLLIRLISSAHQSQMLAAAGIPFGSTQAAVSWPVPLPSVSPGGTLFRQSSSPRQRTS